MNLNVKSKDFDHLADLLTFIDYRTEGYSQIMGRVMLNGTIFSDRITADSEYKGFFVDIFIIENVPDNALLRRLHGIISMITGGLLSCRNFYRSRKTYLPLARQNPKAAGSIRVKIFIGCCVSFLSCVSWGKITRKVYSLCKNEHSKYVSIPMGRKHYFGEMYERTGMMNTIAFPFEGHKWQVAQNYDAYFTVLYGADYMTPPPPENREHHIIFELKFPDG